MRRINGKLTAADRSGTTLLDEHQMFVCGHGQTPCVVLERVRTKLWSSTQTRIPPCEIIRMIQGSFTLPKPSEADWPFDAELYRFAASGRFGSSHRLHGIS